MSFKSGLVVMLGVALVGLDAVARAGTFDTYNVGSIDQQQGWTTRDAFLTSTTVGNWDQGIVNLGDRKVWRLSNAVTSGTFTSQPFSYKAAEVAGESGANLWNDRGTNGASPISPALPGGTATTDTFYSKVSFRSATGAAQTGLNVVLSASAKQSAVRMSWLQIADTGSGFDLRVYDLIANGGFPAAPTTIASGLSYTALHTLETQIVFRDGVTMMGTDVYGNDELKVYLDGALVHTGSTWEGYYYNYERITAGQPRLQAVDSMLFRVAGSAATGTAGNGFYFEDVVVSNTTIPEPASLSVLGLGAAALLMRRRR